MIRPNWLDEAEKMFVNNECYSKIAEKLGTDRKLVSYWIRKLGYSTPKNRLRNAHSKRTYEMNDDIFETIDSEEKAYWLGFIYADGCISESKNDIELFLKEEDLKHIEAFKKFLQATNPIKKKIKNNKYISYGIRVTSSKVKNDLIILGAYPNKTSILKFPKESQVEKSLVPHFLRGYFDGDGCITKTTQGHPAIEILGTLDFLQGIIEYFDLPISIHGFSHSSINRIQLFGNNFKTFTDSIYNQPNVYLNRKYQRYKTYLPDLYR